MSMPNLSCEMLRIVSAGLVISIRCVGRIVYVVAKLVSGLFEVTVVNPLFSVEVTYTTPYI